jgi:hypothetical protein
MKRVLLGAVTLLAALTAAGPAHACHTFGLFICHKCCGHHRCCACECPRPYNAFSPACGAGMTDGCMPFASNMPGLEYGQASSDGSRPTSPATNPSGPAGSGSPAPSAPMSPKPLPPGHGAAPYYPGYTMQPVGYYPAMPAYGPMMDYWNPMGQLPYYWNPMGGR